MTEHVAQPYSQLAAERQAELMRAAAVVGSRQDILDLIERAQESPEEATGEPRADPPRAA